MGTGCLKEHIAPFIAKVGKKAKQCVNTVMRLTAPIAAKAVGKAKPYARKTASWAVKQPCVTKAYIEMRKRPKVFNRRNAAIAASALIFFWFIIGGGSSSGGGLGAFSPSFPLHPDFTDLLFAKPGSEPARVAVKCRNILCDCDDYFDIEKFLAKDARDEAREKILDLHKMFDSDYEFKEAGTFILNDEAVVMMFSTQPDNPEVFALKRVNSSWLIISMNDGLIGDSGAESVVRRLKTVREYMSQFSGNDVKKACSKSFKPLAKGKDEEFDKVMYAFLQYFGHELNMFQLAKKVFEYGESKKNDAYYFSLKMLNLAMWNYFLYDNWYSGDWFWRYEYKENGWKAASFGHDDKEMAAPIKCLATLSRVMRANYQAQNGIRDEVWIKSSKAEFLKTVKSEGVKEFEFFIPYLH